MSIIRMIWNEIIRIKGMIWSDIIRNKADYFGISLTIISLISYMLIIFFKLSTNYIPYKYLFPRKKDHNYTNKN